MGVGTTDQTAVVSLSPTIWLLMAGVASLAVLAMLYTFASLIRNETHIHDLRVEVSTLQANYLKRMLRMQKGGSWDEVVDVDIVDDDEDIPEVSPIETRNAA